MNSFLKNIPTVSPIPEKITSSFENNFIQRKIKNAEYNKLENTVMRICCQVKDDIKISFIANAVLYTGIKKLELDMFAISTDERAINGRKSRKNNGIVYNPAST